MFINKTSACVVWQANGIGIVYTTEAGAVLENSDSSRLWFNVMFDWQDQCLLLFLWRMCECMCVVCFQAISTALFTHQKQALCWMTAAENSDRLPPFWLQRGSSYYNSLTSFSSQTKPRSIRGGLLGFNHQCCNWALVYCFGSADFVCLINRVGRFKSVRFKSLISIAI